ncbi:uncharacterized protein LOC120187665 [Hibiscus syriacus]|uniref:uncharacterized protein LOC120187665 n=1 Tax=Hibiscus syriacus TaxID=106335 RepID=UPI0019214F9B|nr:uncharacterized protein LOC120187665 [Hibiscus syriacus]
MILFQFGQLSQLNQPLPQIQQLQNQMLLLQPPEKTETPQRETPAQTQTVPTDHTTTPPPPTEYCQTGITEYPKVYEDYTLRCQANNCREAFHEVLIPSPPVNGDDSYLCTFGIFPIGFLVKGKFPSWSSVLTMFSLPNNQNAGKHSAGKSSPRVFYDEDDVYVEKLERSSEDNSDEDDDW